MFGKLLEAIFGIREGTSWIDLDDRMRGQLRFWGVVSVFGLLFLIVFSLWYVQWLPIHQFVDFIWKDVKRSVLEKGEIPKWLITVVPAFFVVTVFLSLVFFYFLFSFAKMHYKIDAVTLRVIPKVGRHIQSLILTRFQCPAGSDCSLYQLLKTRRGRRQFMKTVFYQFANRDSVGSHNQAEKRRQVFSFWTKYYVFNYVMVVSLLVWLWLSFVALIKTQAVLVCVVSGIGILVLVGWWWKRGRYYKQGALELAEDQVNAFLSNAYAEVIQQARSLIASCSSPACRVN